PEEGFFVAMILTCPNCGTQYVVKDGAIPPQGRQVRCAACKHSWHQDPEASPVEPESELQPRTQEQETLTEATMIEPRGGPEAEERAYEGTALKGEPLEQSQSPAPEPELEPEQSNARDARTSEAAEF